MGFTFPYGGSPNLLVPIVMFGWIPLVVYFFMRFPARRAVVISFVVAWLFLPLATLELPGIPDYTKMSATCYGIIIATCIFDVDRFKTFKFSWIDIPMLIWCLCPLASSLSNDLGLYDGLTAVLGQTVTWGVPYFLGRIYLNDLTGLRELAIWIFVGGLIYVPLCLFEVRMSPQLHRMFYGGHQHGFGQTLRLGGFRPTVFMEHGLAVGAFMMAATLVGIWLWKTGVIRQLWGIPVSWLVGVLFVTFILVKSSGAYWLLALGVLILFVGWRFQTSWLVFILILCVGLYLYQNAETERYVTDQWIAFLSNVYGKNSDRMGSLLFRFDNEELLVDRARERIIFGWGGWGRNLVLNPETGKNAVTDSLWIIAFGSNGTVGLVSLFSALLLPVAALFWIYSPASLWSKREYAPAVALAVGLSLFAVDCLLNAMLNPIFVLAAGGLAGFAVKRPEQKGLHWSSNRIRQRLLPSESIEV